ncbi:MAG: ABC transporter permease subunit [Acidimicrobiales bacterium]
MRPLVAAEVLKLRTTRVFYSLCAATATLGVLGVVGGILTAGRSGSPALETDEGLRNVFGGGGTGALFALVLGILAVTGEIRHGTITQTLLVTPRRSRLMAAKLAAMAIGGAAIGALASLVTLAVAWPWLAIKGIDVSVFSADVGLVMVAGIVGTVFFGIIGVGFGAVVRNQVPAIVGALIWQFVLEAILVGLLPSVGKWLPGGAARGLAGETLQDGDLLPVWAAAVVLTAYALAFAAAGSRLLARRDIT